MLIKNKIKKLKKLKKKNKNKTLKRSTTVHVQSYPLALAEKEQLATASAVFGNFDSTQSATPIPVTRNSEPIYGKIFGSGMYPIKS